MATNIYIFWKETSDPPSPWTRLTRTNKYLRFDSSVANHWADIGAATHNHDNVMEAYSCNSFVYDYRYRCCNYYDEYDWPMVSHTHAQNTWSIPSSNNTPAGYGLDIIYMDMATWESSVRSFPAGSVVMSNGALTDGELARFTDADGKLIYNAAPGTATGSDSTHTHAVTGTLAIGATCGSSLEYWDDNGGCVSHSHTVSLTSTSGSVAPKTLVTRLYYMLQNTSRALYGIVVFVDGETSANWTALTSWAGGNLKAGDSNPTLSGSDTHNHTISGNTSVYYGPYWLYSGSDAYQVEAHHHTISATLKTVSHVPASKLIVPVQLNTTLFCAQVPPKMYHYLGGMR